MTTQESGGITMLIMLAIIIGGPMIFGVKFWGWFFIIGGVILSMLFIIWIFTLLRGVTRWAKRQ